MTALAICATAAITVQTYALNMGAEILCERLRLKTFSALLQQDTEYFDEKKNASGSLTSRVSELPSKVYGMCCLVHARSF